MNETNLTKYANGFTITVNKEAGEMLIAFTQNQPSTMRTKETLRQLLQERCAR